MEGLKGLRRWGGRHRNKILFSAVSCITVVALLAGIGILVTSGGSGLEARTKSGQTQQQNAKKEKGRGGPMGLLGKEALNDAASVLGISSDELKKQLQSGKTILQIAQAKGISKDKLKSSLEKKFSESIDKAAKEAKSNLDDFVSNFVEKGLQRRDGPMDMLGIDVPTEVAAALGVSADDLKKELQLGKTIAQVAQAKGISTDTIAAALKQKINDAADKAVKDGKVTQDQATKIKSGLDRMVQNIVQRGPRPPGGGPGRQPGAGRGQDGQADQQPSGLQPQPAPSI